MAELPFGKWLDKEKQLRVPKRVVTRTINVLRMVVPDAYDKPSPGVRLLFTMSDDYQVTLDLTPEQADDLRAQLAPPTGENRPAKPERERAVNVTYYYKNTGGDERGGSIFFDGTPEAMKDFADFGSVEKVSSFANRYILRVDSRVNFDRVLDYIRAWG